LAPTINCSRFRAFLLTWVEAHPVEKRFPMSVSWRWAKPSPSDRHCRSLIASESPSQPPHPDADIILETYLALVRAITRKYAQLR
jgi:hypothetical protein